MYRIIGKNRQEWRVVIGLEVHAQIISNAKLFSKSSNSFDDRPNTNVSFFDMALPGTLPVINNQCINQAIKAGKAINGTIEKYSRFDRKNYFYPDLPSGYQISQFFHPIVTNGELDIELEDGSTKNIRIERIHMEQDAGKSIHLDNSNKTYIDLNRSGVGLLEIVSCPDISSPYEAAEYLKKLRLLLKYIGVCDGNMECGSLRCDANVSVCHVDSIVLGTRCEIKNLNSMKYIMQAIEYEANIQVESIENGEEIVQSTKSFNVETGETKMLRKKEQAAEYRYFPDPDLLPIVLTDKRINDALKDFPELPDIKKKHYIENLKLSKADADLIVSERTTVDYFESAIQGIENEAKTLANLMIAELFGLLNKNEIPLIETKVTPYHLRELVTLIKTDIISSKIAKDVLLEVFNNGKMPKDIVKEKGLEQVTDISILTKIIDTIINNNPESVTKYKEGKTKLFGFFVGEAMKATKGKANPQVINDLLKNKLK